MEIYLRLLRPYAFCSCTSLEYHLLVSQDFMLWDLLSCCQAPIRAVASLQSSLATCSARDAWEIVLQQSTHVDRIERSRKAPGLKTVGVQLSGVAEGFRLAGGSRLANWSGAKTACNPLGWRFASQSRRCPAPRATPLPRLLPPAGAEGMGLELTAEVWLRSRK